MRKYTRRLIVASALALTVVTAPVAHAEDQILASVPGLTFPFFVHMMNAFKAEIVKQGYGVIESDGQVSSPKQTADVEAAITQGVKGIVISPNEVDAMAPALQQAVEAEHSGGHRRPPRALGRGHSRPCRRRQREGRRSPGQPHRLRCSPMAPPSSTCRASPAPRRPSTATRACTTCSIGMADKYKIVFEQTAGFDRAKGLAVTEAALSGMAEAAEGDRRRQ